MLPLIILLLSVAIAAVFFPRLPAEVGYHFKPDGSPDRWQNRSVITLLMLLPQFFLTLVAWVLTYGVVKVSGRFRQADAPGIAREKVVLIMGNMVALPQLILSFVMLDIFSYNSYRIHLLPLWAFALVVMGVGGIILGIFFVQAIKRAVEATRQPGK